MKLALLHGAKSQAPKLILLGALGAPKDERSSCSEGAVLRVERPCWGRGSRHVETANASGIVR